MSRVRIVLILTENWTMRPAPDVAGLVQFAIGAERAGLDAVMISEHVVLGPSADAAGPPDPAGGRGADQPAAAPAGQLIAVGSLRNFAASPGSAGRVRVVVSAVIAIAITAGAIYGSFYKVTSPTIYAPWIALAVLVIGFASTFVTRARRSASTELSDLTKSTA